MRSYAGQQQEQLGEGMMRAGGGLGRLADAEQHQLDLATGKALENRQMAQQAAIMRAYEAKVGKDAVDAYEPTLKALEQQHQAIMAELGKSDASTGLKTVAALALQQNQIRAADGLARHNAQQVRVWNAGESKTAADLATQQAIGSFDPSGARGGTAAGAFAADVSAALHHTDEYAAALGIPEGSAQWNALRLARTSDLHVGVVQRLLSDQQPDRARQYLEGVPKDQVDSGSLTRLQDLVHRGTVSERARAMANAATAPRPFVAKQGQEPKDFADYFQQQQAQYFQQLAEEEDRIARDPSIPAEVADQAVARIRQAREQRRVNVRDSAIQTQEQGEKWLMDNPKAGVGDMPAELTQRASAYGVKDQLVAFAENGRRYVNDDAFLAEMLSKDRSELRSIDAGDFYLENKHRLSPDNMKRALNKLAVAQGRADWSGIEKERDEDAIKAAAEEAGIKVLSGNEFERRAAAPDFARFREAALSTKMLGDKPMPDILKAMVSTHLKVTSGKNFYAAPAPEQAAAEFIGESGRPIPLSQILDENNQPMVEQLRAELASQGLPSGIEDISRRYEALRLQRQAAQPARELNYLQQAMASQGIQAVGEHVDLEDAARLVGLTGQSLRDRGAELAVTRRDGQLRFVVTKQSLAKILYERQRELQRKK